MPKYIGKKSPWCWHSIHFVAVLITLECICLYTGTKEHEAYSKHYHFTKLYASLAVKLCLCLCLRYYLLHCSQSLMLSVLADVGRGFLVFNTFWMGQNSTNVLTKVVPQKSSLWCANNGCCLIHWPPLNISFAKDKNIHMTIYSI